MYRSVSSGLFLRVFSRRFCSWMTAKQSAIKKDNVEKLFTHNDVQQLLYRMTAVDPQIVFEQRHVKERHKTEYQLMTEEEMIEISEEMEKEARKRLQFPPFLNPRADEMTILSKDSEIADHDKSKFVFTDITFGISERERNVVVREPDGILRLATIEEHDRMNRFYLSKELRQIFPPQIFDQPYLEDAMKAKNHIYLLDWACFQYEPDNPEYIRICKEIYDDVDKQSLYDILRSSRHYGGFLFYLTVNQKINGILGYFLTNERFTEAADFVRLQHVCFPGLLSIGMEARDDLHFVQNFVEHDTPKRGALQESLRKMLDKRR